MNYTVIVIADLEFPMSTDIYNIVSGKLGFQRTYKGAQSIMSCAP